MIGKLTGSSAVLTAVLFVASPVSATEFVFTTNGSNTATDGDAGNKISLTKDGITVTATAWSAGSSGNPVKAYIGRYQNGLGVTSLNEDGSNNTHIIDNVGDYDFVRLDFSSDVKLTGLNMTPFSIPTSCSFFGCSYGNDNDAWVSYGTSTSAFSDAGVWSGYLNRGKPYSGDASVTIPDYSKVWLVGASRIADDRDDGFKLSAITAVAAPPVTPSVPEPATWLMMISGFGAIGGVLRKRKVNFAPTAA